MIAMPSSAALLWIPDLVVTFSSVHVSPLRKYNTCSVSQLIINDCTVASCSWAIATPTDIAINNNQVSIRESGLGLLRNVTGTGLLPYAGG